MLYICHFLETGEKLPNRENISAVFLVAFHNDKVLSIKNERGWDIPGGHLEGDEDSLTGLKREVLEEAGALVNNAKPYAILSSATSSKVMLFFASNSIELTKFFPSEDALGRDPLNQDELINLYYGDKGLLKSLIDCARKQF